MNPTPQGEKSPFISPLAWKLFAIGLITLLLLIPTALLFGLIHDRVSNKDRAISDVSSTWGKAQTITGPMLGIPYTRYQTRYNAKKEINEQIKTTHWFYILPDELKINGVLQPEIRYRGIYEVPVYTADVNISGTFSNLYLDKLDAPAEDVHLEKARLFVAISDLRGIEQTATIAWADQTYDFEAGIKGIINPYLQKGINTNVSLSEDPLNDTYTFSLDLQVRGSERILVNPVGKETTVALASTWPSPSFSGQFLPDSREVTESGFEATWRVNHLNRNYPQYFTSIKDVAFVEADLGVDLYVPVDNYQKSERSVKYAILIISLTFLTFFFIELSQVKPVHPIQYILIGLALCVFYTLLISISEFLSFNVSYGIATILTLGLISIYSSGVLKSTRLSLLSSSILFFLYIYIFILIQLETLALLVGSIGLFLILGCIMIYSRNFNWNKINNS